MTPLFHTLFNFCVGLAIGFGVAYLCDKYYPDIPVWKNWRYWVGGFGLANIYLLASHMMGF